MFPLGPLHPQDIVKKEFVVVGWGQPFQAQIRPVNDYFAKFADL
jgi:hypothetical protein